MAWPNRSWGSPRVTYDVDLCYDRNAGNLHKIAKALQEIESSLRGAPSGVPFILDAKSLAMGQNFTFDTKVIALDILGWVEPIGTYQELIQTAEDHVYKGRGVKVIALDQLIRVKEHINRPKDRDALFQLRAIKQVREEQGRDA